MAQDAAPPPSAQALTSAMAATSSQPREYYTDQPCEEGMGCGGEGIVLPFEDGNVELDEMFGFTDVESMPLSDEILPVIFDGALITEDGLLDSFARHYPERASFLLQILSDTGAKSLGLGYKLEFLDDAAQTGPMRLEHAAVTEEYGELAGRLAQVRGQTRSALMMGQNPTQMAEGDRLEGERIRLSNRIKQLDNTLGNAGRWRINDATRTIHIYTTINANVERALLAEHVPFSDDGINPLPTNKEGADWLYAVMGDWMARNGYPGAGPEEEFFRNWLTRKAAGAALVGLGALEIFGGVTIAMGSGGLATVGGVALTVVGFDAMTNGFDMLWTPDRHAGERGWIGDLINDTATRFGGEEVAQKFNRGWAVTQIAVGLGAPLAIRYAARKATSVAASGQQIRPMARGQLDTARLAIAEIKGHKFGRGLTGDYSPLPSGRGAIIDLQGVGRFRLPALDSDIRVLMRLRRSAKATLQARFARLTRSQGPSVVRDQASATRLLEKAAEHSGVDLWKYVDEVRYGDFDVPSFSLQGQVRVIQIPNRISQSNKYMQLKIAAHEINHARIYDKFLKRLGHVRGHEEYWGAHRYRGTPLYAREEVIVERAATMLIRSVFEGKLTGANLRRFTAALDDSADYLSIWRARM